MQSVTLRDIYFVFAAPELASRLFGILEFESICPVLLRYHIYIPRDNVCEL